MVKIINSPQYRSSLKSGIKFIYDPDWKNDIIFNDLDLTRINVTKESYLEKWGFYDYLLESVYHIIYDSLETHDEKWVMSRIGDIFYTEEEASKIYEYCSWFHDLTYFDIEEVEEETTLNSAYFDHPEWPRVISEGKAIVKMMEENEKKYDIDASWARWS